MFSVANNKCIISNDLKNKDIYLTHILSAYGGGLEESLQVTSALL